MKVNVEISMGEYFDKITILKIKQAHGIGDSKELDMLLSIKQDETNSSTIDSLVGILLTINSELWDIEDGKRQCEKVRLRLRLRLKLRLKLKPKLRLRLRLRLKRRLKLRLKLRLRLRLKSK